MTKARPLIQSKNRKKPESLQVLIGIDEESSLYNLVPGKLREAIDRMDPALVTWPESRLERETEPDDTDHALRISFWAEYYRAVDIGRSESTGTHEKMALTAILRRVTHYPYFKASYLDPGSEMKLAWLLSPPKDLALKQEDTLNQAMRKLRDIVKNADVYDTVETIDYDKHGNEKKRHVSRKFNARAADSVTKIAEFMSNRVQGTLLNRHAIMATQVPPPANQAPVAALPPREDLEGRIQVLDQALNSQDAEVLED